MAQVLISIWLARLSFSLRGNRSSNGPALVTPSGRIGYDYAQPLEIKNCYQTKKSNDHVQLLLLFLCVFLELSNYLITNKVKMATKVLLRPNETFEDFYNRCNNLTLFDCSENEMLWWMMGSRMLPLVAILPISIVLVVIFLTGVVGNVCVCVVIVRHPGLHTATNYYLFSLAVSDLLLLLFGK